MKTIKKHFIGTLLLMAGATQCLWAQESYSYMERSWDGTKVVTTEKTCSSYTAINGSSENDWLALYDGWYVVTNPSKYRSLVVQGTDVHLIIPDMVSLSLTGGVRLMAGHKLSIYSQRADAGFLNAINDYDGAAGIGSATEEGVEKAAGDLVIHGGVVTAKGGKYGAGIGSGAKSIEENTNLCGTVTIYGGIVTATGGEDGAGIGGGAGYKERGNHGGRFFLYGGEVTAQGGDEAAGVGGGGGYDPSLYSSVWGGKGGRVEVYGGELKATGGSKGAGIGSGEQYSPNSADAAMVLVYGGTVTAQGGDYGAGIGGGQNGGGAQVEVSGGTVTATGGKYGAGIGGGENSRGGEFKITGGSVTATGAPGAAGIGGGDGDSGYGGQNYIYGGTVIASAGTQGGTNNRAIGPGDNIEWENNPGFVLELGNEMAVYAGNIGATDAENQPKWFSNGERVEACKYRSYAKIEPCTHEASTTYTCELDQHKGNCYYCNLQAGGSHTLIDGKCSGCGAIILSDNSDNSSILSSNNGTETPAVFLKGRTIWKNGRWNTLCLPFSLSTLDGTPLEGATVKTLSSASFADGKLTLNFGNAVDAIEAGKPYMVKWKTTTINSDDPKFENVTISKANNDITAPNTVSGEESVVTFCGIFSPYNIEGEDRTMLYLGDDKTLFFPSAKMTLGAFRAYFRLQGITAGDLAAGARSVVLDFDDETTLINEVSGNNTAETDAWFSLDGRRLASKPSVKGIYLNNGKKVIIK